MGINLLRGSDLPEVFVAILDADKEGFLRAVFTDPDNRTCCSQRPRQAILYADVILIVPGPSMRQTGVGHDRWSSTKPTASPTSIIKPIEATPVTAYEADYFKVPVNLDAFDDYRQTRSRDDRPYGTRNERCSKEASF